jgi:hypothetical protein
VRLLPLAALALAAAPALGACRLGLAGAQSGTRPRAGQAVRLSLFASDERAGKIVVAALAADSRIGIEPASEASCRPLLRAAYDYHVYTSLGSRYDHTGKVENEHSKAVFQLQVYEADTCRLVMALSRELTAIARGPKEQSEPEALDSVAAKIPAALTGLFPDQLVLERPDQIARGRGDGAARGAIYALYRERDFRGYLRVDHVGEQASTYQLLTCCFAPRAGDVLVSRGRHTLLDFVPTVTVGQVASDAVFGGGLQTRIHPMDGGWMVGLGADLAAEADTSIWMVTLEGGWEFRPSARWELAAVGGLGFGARHDDGATDSDYGVHGSIVARGGYHILPYWFITFDAGVVTASYDLDGPLFRLGTGVRL